jgi:hypothetical protein
MWYLFHQSEETAKALPKESFGGALQCCCDRDMEQSTGAIVRNLFFARIVAIFAPRLFPHLLKDTG